MSLQISLKEIIYKNSICIRYNPIGIVRLWPYSYIEKFYNTYCESLYRRNSSPNILEINQSNNLNLKLWQLFFENPRLENLTKKEILTNNHKSIIKYDMIIINDKDLINIQDIDQLITLLKNDGLIIIENIGRSPIKVANLFLNNFRQYGIEILDYRFKRFLLKNCILLIKKNKDRNIIEKIKKFFLFFQFIVFENIISFALIIFKK